MKYKSSYKNTPTTNICKKCGELDLTHNKCAMCEIKLHGLINTCNFCARGGTFYKV